MECKHVIRKSSDGRIPAFNLTIVECKQGAENERRNAENPFNLTIVECKLKPDGIRAGFRVLLILP